MDLLDSILNGMEKPPSVKKPVIKDKEKREKFEKLQKERQEAEKKQKEMLNKFRLNFTAKLKRFVDTPITNNSETFKLELKPMDKIFRTIIREVGEDYEDDIIIHSFGKEEVDRHCIIWKKGFEPCAEEIQAMKLGVEYKPADSSQEEESDDSKQEAGTSQSKTGDGKDKFWAKYEKIIGENASGVESAKVALPAKQYGYVPIENKKDLRSIEQILEDKRNRKKQKTSDSSENPTE